MVTITALASSILKDVSARSALLKYASPKYVHRRRSSQPKELRSARAAAPASAGIKLPAWQAETTITRRAMPARSSMSLRPVGVKCRVEMPGIWTANLPSSPCEVRKRNSVSRRASIRPAKCCTTRSRLVAVANQPPKHNGRYPAVRHRTLGQEESNHLFRCVGTADIRIGSAGMTT